MLRYFFFEVRELLNLREKGQNLLQMLYKDMLHHACFVYSNDTEMEIYVVYGGSKALKTILKNL